MDNVRAGETIAINISEEIQDIMVATDNEHEVIYEDWVEGMGICEDVIRLVGTKSVVATIHLLDAIQLQKMLPKYIGKFIGK